MTAARDRRQCNGEATAPVAASDQGSRATTARGSEEARRGHGAPCYQSAMSRPLIGAALLLLASACSFDGDSVVDAPAPIDADIADAPVPVDAAPDATADAGADAAPDATGCPAEYVRHDGSRSMYRLVLVADDWLAAELDCEDDGASSHLVVLDDAAELAVLDPLTSPKIWVGTTDRVFEGTFFSVTTGVAPFTPWQSGEPNNSSNEDCAELDGNQLNDEGCGDTRAYLCECDGIPAMPVAYTEI
jgi:hypothetical protein